MLRDTRKNGVSFVTFTRLDWLTLLLLTTFFLPSFSGCGQFAPSNYTEKVKTAGTIESRYMGMGEYEVEKAEFSAEAPLKTITVYYPKTPTNVVERFPLVIYVNGTGVAASTYTAVLKHLASWGFVASGNEDPSTWSGESADETLRFLLSQNDDESSALYDKIDVKRIGISGHSQGGVGVFNAITQCEHSGSYTAAIAISPTSERSAASLRMPYDATKVATPLLLLAGDTGGFETKMVIPFAEMTKLYERIPTSKVMARRRGGDHGGMLYSADGYAVAWFMALLKDDEEAWKAFRGDSPEILSNPLYRDQRIDWREEDSSVGKEVDTQ